MKFYDYQSYLDYYTEGLHFLGEHGDSMYYDDCTENHIIKLPSESSHWLDSESNGKEPIIFYCQNAVNAIRLVWENEFDYEYSDEFDQDLMYSEDLESA